MDFSAKTIPQTEKNNPLLLISIQPKFAELIRSGAKTVELRKKKPKLAADFAVIYESYPKMHASFLIKIKKIEHAPTNLIWKKYGRKSGVSKQYFFDYYREAENGVAILIDKVFPFEQNISRQILVENGLTPPQDYRYATTETLVEMVTQR